MFGVMQAQQTNHEIGKVVSEVCQKEVVLLGEDSHHGSGKTLEVKVDLVKLLVNKCGFSEIFSESQLYDFVNLKNRIAQRTAKREELADAIGGFGQPPRKHSH